MTRDLRKALGDRASLRELAGERSYTRGVGYFSDGSVHSLAEYEGMIAAIVKGTQDYRVKLWLESGGIEHSCSCPMGEMGEFCKHCVATALAYTAEAETELDETNAASGKPGQGGRAKTTDGRRRTTLDAAREHLARQSKNDLIDLILRRALEDDEWRERLMMDAARTNPVGVDLGTFRRTIAERTRTGGFVDYHARACTRAASAT